MAGDSRARLLLDLLATATGPDASDIAAVDAAGWLQIEAWAALHRLGPLIHARHHCNPAIPPRLREAWRDAHRHYAMAAMAQQADLADCVLLLEAHGFSPVALKGAFLARYAYPAPALRPMRDIDLLLPPEQVLPAFRLLLEAQYKMDSQPKAALEDIVRLELHMPPVSMPRGSVLELHARISELDGKLEYATPAGNEALLLSRTIARDGIRYPCPQDMLAHLIVHAVYGHRLDCGPLVLSDIHYLALAHPIDWPMFWDAARAGGWQRGARLVIELARRFHGCEALPVMPQEPAAPSEKLIAVSCNLLLQDYVAKKPARFLATILTGGFSTLLKRASGRVTGEGERTLTLDRTSDGGKISWALQQCRQLWNDLSDPAVRQQARELARFKRWLHL